MRHDPRICGNLLLLRAIMPRRPIGGSLRPTLPPSPLILTLSCCVLFGCFDAGVELGERAHHISQLRAQTGDLCRERADILRHDNQLALALLLLSHRCDCQARLRGKGGRVRGESTRVSSAAQDLSHGRGEKRQPQLPRLARYEGRGAKGGLILATAGKQAARTFSFSRALLLSRSSDRARTSTLVSSDIPLVMRSIDSAYAPEGSATRCDCVAGLITEMLIAVLFPG